MSTALEDRLTDALHARAELVQPESLTHHAPGVPAPRPPWRRPALVVLAAAACIAVVVAVATRGGHGTDQRPLPPTSSSLPSGRFPLPTPTLADHLTGDVDGDGRPDQIRVSGHTLTVRLAADPGHPVTRSDPDLQGLVGLADLGGPGRAVLQSVNDLVVGSEWQAIELRNGKLVLVLVRGHGWQGSVGVVPGHEFSWLTSEGVLMSGGLDPMQVGERRLAVSVSRVVGRAGRPVLTPLGGWCWDVATQRVPAPCPAGADYSYDAGRHGSLPALLPMNGPADGAISPIDGAWRQGSASLRLAEGPVHAASEFDQVYDLVGTIDGHRVSARAGVFQPTLLTRFLDLGHGVRGLAVDDESDQRWNILPYVDGRLVTPSVPGDLRPGDERYQTWVGPDGQAFTRVPHGSAGHFEVYEWQVTDSSGRTLQAVDLGLVCMDDTRGTYGICPGG